MRLFLSVLVTGVILYESLGKELNCDKLKECLENITKDASCKCGTEEKMALNKFNVCMIKNGFAERCVQQKTKEICFSWSTCDQQGSRCYDRFHDEFNKTEEVMFETCLGDLNQH